MRHFPIFLDLRGLVCLVVGAGPVGARRAAGLAAAGARVRIVTPEVGSAARALTRRARRSRSSPRSGSVRLERRRFRASDLRGCALVVAATGDRRVDAAIARAARRKRIPCNVAGEPALGTFIVPAVARRGGLTFAVSTGGASPTLARSMARTLARSLARCRARDAGRPIGAAHAAYARFLRAARSTLRRRVQDPATRRRALRRLASTRLVALAGAGHIAEAKAQAHSIVEAAVEQGRRRGNIRGKIRGRSRRL